MNKETYDLTPILRGSGVQLINAERENQLLNKEWTPEHDDELDSCELSDAAACYMTTAALQVMGGCGPDDCQDHWPFGERWNPSDDPIRNLVKAGALIAAEIDRLHRAMEDAPSHYNNEETARALREGGVSSKEENADVLAPAGEKTPTTKTDV